MLLWLPGSQVLAKQQGPREHFWRLTHKKTAPERKHNTNILRKEHFSPPRALWWARLGCREPGSGNQSGEGWKDVCLSAQRAPESPCTTYSHPGKLGTPNWEATESLTRQRFVSSKTGFLDPSTQALGTSLLKASHWSSWESNFWHYRLEKIFPLLTPSLHSHNLSVRLKTTALLHSEQKMQLQS